MFYALDEYWNKMRTVTKKMIAGLALVAFFIAVAAGIAGHVPPITVLKRAAAATAVFGLLTFLCGLVYEKIWRR